jgi:hypothetical protein
MGSRQGAWRHIHPCLWALSSFSGLWAHVTAGFQCVTWSHQALMGRMFSGVHPDLLMIEPVNTARDVVWWSNLYANIYTVDSVFVRLVQSFRLFHDCFQVFLTLVLNNSTSFQPCFRMFLHQIK